MLSMKKHSVWLVALVGLVVASLLAWWVPRLKAPSNPSVIGKASSASASQPVGTSGNANRQSGPVVVEVKPAQIKAVTDDLTAVGTIKARQTIMIRPEVAGRVQSLFFNDGDRVNKGQVMVQLDDTLLKAQLQQAQAQLSIATSNHARNLELVKEGFITQSATDQTAANVQVAQAQVATVRAQLSRLKIVAPFDGITGIRKINVGDYIRDGSDVVELQDNKNLVVDFKIPERSATAVHIGMPVKLQLDGLGQEQPRARITATESTVDTDGRALTIRAQLEKVPATIKAGMFVRVNVILAERPQAIVIPEESVVSQGKEVWVYKVDGIINAPQGEKQKLKAIKTVIKTGNRGEGWVEVTEGLTAQDQVITAGQSKIRGAEAEIMLASAPQRGSAKE